MDLFEYQARELFEHYGVPVLPGVVAHGAPVALSAAKKFFAEGHDKAVLKAQVKTGGRGKAGGVRLVGSNHDAFHVAKEMLGMDIKGHKVQALMVTTAVSIAQEFYFSILLDRSERKHLILFSTEGGVEIEQLAKERPDALVRYHIDPDRGAERRDFEEICTRAGVTNLRDRFVDVMQKLYEIYIKEDAVLVEVNPLILTKDSAVLALDGKVTLDDNAAYRHPDRPFSSLVHEEIGEVEAKAAELGLNYVKLDGQVGIIGNGAGLVMSTLDVVAGKGQAQGVRPANFLDIGGGASASLMTSALGLVMGDIDVKSVFVNVFGGITACDAVATGILGAIDALGQSANKPIVVRLDGNRAQEGRKILADASCSLIFVEENMDIAAEKAVALCDVKAGC